MPTMTTAEVAPMSKRITFRFVPATWDENGRYHVSYWVHDASGVEIHAGEDASGDIPVTEWCAWTRNWGKPLTSGFRSLNDCKEQARWVITERPEWLE